MPMVTITVQGGQSFSFHKDVLIENSLYFEKALNGNFIESQTQSIDLDDIDAETFGLYASLVYPAAAINRSLSLSDVWTTGKTTKFPWKDILRLWQLADRFLNQKIMLIVRFELDKRFGELSIDRWLGRYQNTKWSYIKAYVAGLNAAYRLCDLEGIPFQQRFIDGLGNCPPQILAECVEELDDDFKSAVVKKFALRLADPDVTAKKRMGDEMREAKRSAKKQKRSE